MFGKYNTLVMIGRPGSGKGVQTKLMVDKTGFKTFSTGDKLRELKKADTPIGRKIADTIDKGNLMPHWFASFLFEEAVIYLPPEQGIVYEGAGRKPEEAQLFDEVMTWLGRPYKALYLDVADEVSMRRLSKRREMEGREDDAEAVILDRLNVYKKEVAPAIEVFRKNGALIDINGDQTPEEVHEEIVRKLSEA